jgi:hypothetical protein
VRLVPSFAKSLALQETALPTRRQTQGRRDSAKGVFSPAPFARPIARPRRGTPLASVSAGAGAANDLAVEGHLIVGLGIFPLLADVVGAGTTARL